MHVCRNGCIVGEPCAHDHFYGHLVWSLRHDVFFLSCFIFVKVAIEKWPGCNAARIEIGGIERKIMGFCFQKRINKWYRVVHRPYFACDRHQLLRSALYMLVHMRFGTVEIGTNIEMREFSKYLSNDRGWIRGSCMSTVGRTKETIALTK